MSTCLNLLSGAALGLAQGLGIGSWRLRFQDDAKLLNREKRIFLESKIQELARKLQIEKPVELIEVEGLSGGSMQAQGMALLSGRAGIAIDPVFVDRRSHEELEFLIAHELAHIKANDSLRTMAHTAAVGISWTVAAIKLMPASATYFSSRLVTCLMGVASPAAAVGLAASVIGLRWFSRKREKEADKLAFSICSDAAQKAGVQFFGDVATSGMGARNNQEGSLFSRLKNKLLFDEYGTNRLDIFHPAPLARAYYLQDLMKKA